jgi:hypothetical protein
MIRDRWYVFTAILAIGAGLCGAAQLLLWDAVAPYVVGAVGMGIAWACHEILISVDGLAAMRVGILGEEWTTSELRKLNKHGWRFVNHVMLEWGDIDHALLGPGGFFAIDTKYRSDWGNAKHELDRRADDARKQAVKLQHRLRVQSPRVIPIVTMWGPRLEDHFDKPFEHGRVLFCPGSLLADHLRALPVVADPTAIENAYSSLDQYVATRDVGEMRDSGAPVRSISEHFNDLAFATLGALLSLLAAVLPARFPPVGLWSFATAAAVAALSLVVRRRLIASVRAQRVTAATITTSTGWCVLIAVLFLITLVQ